jgi:hypothetical protein
LIAQLTLLGKTVELRYGVRDTNAAPSAVILNGRHLPLTTRDRNPYRLGGWRVPAATLSALLDGERNTIQIEL